MPDLAIQQVLAQMRVMQAKAQAVEKPDANVVQANFSELFQQSLDRVNTIQKTSGGLTKAYDSGDPNVNLAEVMIATQKASIAFTAAVEVRNKLLEAYNEVKTLRA